VEEYETINGPTDHALGVDGSILGIVESKKLTLGPQNVLTATEAIPVIQEVQQQFPRSSIHPHATMAAALASARPR
jgi:hypothetical protein